MGRRDALPLSISTVPPEYLTFADVAMVKIEAVRASNARVKAFPRGLVAIFGIDIALQNDTIESTRVPLTRILVGGTSGIAESTAKEFCRYAVEPTVILIGRNTDAATRIISELESIAPAGTYSFIQKDVSLLKNVDEACELIQSQVSKVNLLLLSSATMSLRGRDETPEGIDKKLATNYYSRMRFTQQLLPLLRVASPELSRVVSVLAPGTESASFNRKDLGLKENFSLSNAANHAVVMTDFCFEEFAKDNPTVSFIHSFPSFVRTLYSLLLTFSELSFHPLSLFGSA